MLLTNHKLTDILEFFKVKFFKEVKVDTVLSQTQSVRVEVINFGITCIKRMKHNTRI